MHHSHLPPLPSLDEVKQKLQKKNPNQLEFVFMLLLPLTETNTDASIKNLAVNVVVGSYKARKKFLSNETRQSLVAQVDVWNNTLKKELITLASRDYEIAEPLLEHYYKYLTTITSATPNKVEIGLAKVAGVDLRARKNEAVASARDIYGAFKSPPYLGVEAMKNPSCSPSASNTTQHANR